MSTIKFILRPGTYFKKEKISYARDPKKESSIYLQYSHRGEKDIMVTGQKCEPRFWDKEQGKPKKDHALDTWLNSLKEEFKKNAISKVPEPDPDKVFEAWAEYKRQKKSNVPEAIFKNSLLARWQDFISWMSETNTSGGKARTAGTIRNNSNSREQLNNFLTEKGRVSVKPEQFTKADFEKFDAFLTKKLSANSVSKVKKHFKSFLRWHIEDGGALGFNISAIKYGETAGVKISLSEKELTKISQTDFKGNNIYRDLMMLQASTGVRISDLQRLCDSLNDDKTAFKIKTKKTGKYVLIPVLPLANEVLKRHHHKIPRVPEQYYRQGIKDIYQELWPSKTIEVGHGDNQKKVFVWEEISSHDMVRTFVDIAAKKGITVPTIATITGKSIQVLLKNYLSEDKDHAAQEVLEKFDVSTLRITK